MAWKGKGGEQPKGDRLYIKGLPAGLDSSAVHALFASYGTVQDAHVLTSSGLSDDGSGQTVAIVRVGSAGEAEHFVNTMNGNILEGLTRPIQLSYASSPGQKNDQKGGQEQWQQGGKDQWGGKGGKDQWGGGKDQSAGKGGQAWQGVTVPPPARVSPYGPGAGAVPPPAGKGGGKGNDVLLPVVQEALKQVEPMSKLYVKHLPMHADDLYLYRAFAPFGGILTAKALNKGDFVIGFVQYQTDGEAAGAISGLHQQTLLDGTVLHVAVKT